MKEKKYALIITGGNINRNYIRTYVKNKRYDMIVAVDGGLTVADELDIMPTHIVGDFDTVSEEVLHKFDKNANICMIRLNPMKDLTDTQSAFGLVIESGCTDVDIVGGTGTRMDHTIANIQTLQMFLGKCNAIILNENNRIRLVAQNIRLNKNETFGKYVSFLPLTENVTGVTLCGFKYPLKDYTFKIKETFSLGVSNEIISENAQVEIKSGILIMIESCD